MLQHDMNSPLMFYLAGSTTSNHLKYEELLALNGNGFIWQRSEGSLKWDSNKSIPSQSLQFAMILCVGHFKREKGLSALYCKTSYITLSVSIYLYISSLLNHFINPSCRTQREQISSYHATEWKLTSGSIVIAVLETSVSFDGKKRILFIFWL